MANPTVATAAAHLPLTLDEIKAQVQIGQDYHDDDAILWTCLEGATNAAQVETERWFVNTTLDYSLDRFPVEDHISLPGGRLVSITSLKYTNDSASETTWADTNYTALSTREPGWLGLATTSTQWPSVTLRPHDGVVIRYVVGYGTGDQVPGDIRSAIKLTAAHLYNNRESVVVGTLGLVATEVPLTAQRLLAPYRLNLLG